MKMVKKSLALLLAVLCAFSLSATAFADDEATYTINVVLTDLGETSVTVKSPVSTTGKSYAYGWKAIGAEGDPVWNTSNVIANLAGSTVGYEIYVKNINTNEMGKAEVIAAPATPSAPVFISCTMTTIKVNANDGYEYRCYNTEINYNSGWQDSNIFEGLQKDTLYTVVQRVKSADNQLLGKEGEGILIRTAYRDKYIPSEKDCRVDISNDGAVRKGTTVTFTATGSFINETKFVYGDTMIYPVNWTAYQVNSDGTDGSAIDSLSGSSEAIRNAWAPENLTAANSVVKKDTIDTSTVNISSGSDPVTVRVYVTYKVYEYKGFQSNGNGTWSEKKDDSGNVITYTEYNDFSVKPAYTTLEKVLEILNKAIAFISTAITWFMTQVGKYLKSTSY